MSYPSQRNFPISFKPKVDICSWILLENAKKNLVFHLGVDAIPLSLKNLLLIVRSYRSVILSIQKLRNISNKLCMYIFESKTYQPLSSGVNPTNIPWWNKPLHVTQFCYYTSTYQKKESHDAEMNPILACIIWGYTYTHHKQ